MHRLCTKLYFDLNFIANISPYIWGNVRGTRGKIMCHTSAGFHAVILIEWISFEWIYKTEENLVEKLEFRIGQIHKILRKKMYHNEKAKQTPLETSACVP